jgi:RNA polymerase sigma factor (sigma-70 family)
MTTCTIEQRDALILNNMNLAERISRSKKRKLSQIDYEELKSAAYLGLVEAANKYDPEENPCFPAYAAFRIVGAVQDYLRELSWGSRSRPVKTSDASLYEEEMGATDEASNEGFFERFTKQLPAAGKSVMRQYYIEERKIKDIASDLGVHQSRVSQLLSDSRNRLKSYWQGQADELWAEVA